MKKIYITLIHGTCGYQTPWILPDSNFRNMLCDNLGANYQVEYFDDFSWGRKIIWKKIMDNTIHARIFGASKLENHILNKNVSNHYLIAHSHGGNIALYAMKNDNVANKIDGLICMGTPFLDHEKTKNLWPSILMSTGVLLMFSWESDSSFMKIYTTAFAICLLIILMINFWFSKEKRKKLLDKINLPIDDLTSLNTEILVLHTENDEAFESLNTSSRILSRIRKVWKFISFWQERLIGIMILSWFVLLGLSKIPLLREFIEGAIDFRLVLENMIIIPLIFILSVLAVFSSIGKLIHGPDYIIWLLTIKLKVLRKLKGDNVENVKVDFETKEGYKHTSIQKHSVKQISTWIKSKN